MRRLGCYLAVIQLQFSLPALSQEVRTPVTRFDRDVEPWREVTTFDDDARLGHVYLSEGEHVDGDNLLRTDEVGRRKYFFYTGIGFLEFLGTGALAFINGSDAVTLDSRFSDLLVTTGDSAVGSKAPTLQVSNPVSKRIYDDFSIGFRFGWVFSGGAEKDYNFFVMVPEKETTDSRWVAILNLHHISSASSPETFFNLAVGENLSLFERSLNLRPMVGLGNLYLKRRKDSGGNIEFFPIIYIGASLETKIIGHIIATIGFDQPIDPILPGFGFPNLGLGIRIYF